MNTDFIKAACSTLHNTSTSLQEGVFLFRYRNQNFIIKKVKKGLIGKLRQLNEYRFYRHTRTDFTYFRSPELIDTCPDKSFILSYIEGKEFNKVPAEVLIPAYIEFQNIKEKSSFIFRYVFLIFRGFFYRVCLVSVFTLIRKIHVYDILKIVRLYFVLSFRQKKYKKGFRMHGDLYCSNMIKTKNSELVFLDFENTFTTKKWPLAELTGLCFYFDDKNLTFSGNYLYHYLESTTEINGKYLKRQVRFGVLQNRQTKGELKKQAYLHLLQTALNGKKFENWYKENM